MENTIAVPQKIKTSVLHDTAIPLLGIYPEEWKAESQEIFVHPGSQQHTLRCPSVSEQISTM